MERRPVQFGKVYETVNGMISAAIGFGFRYHSGKFVCKYCKNKSSARMFTLDDEHIYACNKCSARW